MGLFSITLPEITIQPTAIAPSSRTKATTKPPLGLARWKTLRRVVITAPWVIKLVRILPQAMTTLTLATQVLLAKVARFRFAVQTRREPLSLAYMVRY